MSDNIADLYPLSPLQQGMLFHVLREQGTGLYFNQLSCELRGALNVSAFVEAWRRAVAAFPILRTAMVWEDVEEPLQVVLEEVELPLVEEDWRGIPATEQEARFTSWLDEDRRRGVDLGTPPLMRLSLLRTGDSAYRFVFSHHHILLDGWSVPLLIRQVFVLYESLVRGLTPRVEQGRPFRDYIEWIQERGLEESERFWRHSLAGFFEPTELGRGFPGGSGASTSGRAARRIHLSAATTELLNGLARQQGLTLNTVVQGAWALLLGHHAGTRDVVFGTTVSGRPPELPGVESMVGLFINTLPVRVRLPPEEPLVPWLKELQAWLLEMRQHEHSPLVKVQRWSAVPAGTPLFESLVVFENYPVDTALTTSLPSLEVRDVRSVEADHHPLTLVAVPGRELRLELAHESARFDVAHVDGMLGQLRHLLESMAARPEQRLGELSPVDAAERQRVLREWSLAGGPPMEPALLHRFFEEQVARTPDTEALVFGSERISYAELDARANQLAHHLRGLGVGAESRVMLCLERSPDLIISMLGVLKAGGAYVPVDPAWPAARLQSLLEDSGATVVIVQSRTSAWLEGTRVSRVVFDAPADREAISRASRTAPEVRVLPEQLAYIIYTSGSTGRPKGVLVEHRGASNTVRASRGAWALGPGKRVLQFASASFDVSVFEIFGALSDGAALVLVAREALMPGADLLRVLREERVTTAVLTPSVLEATPVEVLPALESMMVAGEACHPGLPRRWGVGRRFVNAYGPTEISIYATLTDCSPDAEVTPIGRPLAGARAYVLDARLHPVAQGVRGELYVGGEGVTRGYLGRPELTAERYLPDPFSDEPGARMYRTGDVVRWMPDGQLEFFGRADDQVKVRGFRIELGEIESALRAEPSVGESVVVVRKGAQGESKLVAYVVPAVGAAEPSVRTLREGLGTKLPEYMVPALFVVLKALPLTTSGKVDRKALPAPEQSREVADRYEPPRTPEEQALADVWAQVLGQKRVGIHDDFFELGGDSILAIQIISRAAQAGVRVTAKQLFSHPTIARIAAVAGSAPGSAAEQALVTGPVPLTPFQRWFFEQELPEPHHANQSLLFTLTEPVEAKLLEQALRHLRLHHDALRLRFTRDGEGWLASNGDGEGSFPLERVDLSGLEPAARLSALEAHAARTRTSLELRSGLLGRAVLYTSGEREPSKLLLVIHQLAVDGVSWRVLREDLLTALRQLQAGAPVQLPPKTTSFQQWAQRLEAHAQTPAAREEAAYWLGLSWARVSRLPVDLPGGDNTLASARQVGVELDVEETRALLHEVPRAWRTRIDEVLLAALAEAFRRWTGAPGLLVNLEEHGREELLEGVDVSRTVGCFTRLYPVLLEAGEGLEAGLKHIKETLRGIPWRGLGFGVLRYLSGEPELSARMRALPVPEVSFHYRGQLDAGLPEGASLSMASEWVGPTSPERTRRAHLLDIHGVVSGDRLQVFWTYSENIHARETVEALARDFQQALRGLIARCSEEGVGGFTPSDFPLAELGQESLDALVARVTRGDARLQRNIEDLYPLSPLQQGLLFHVLQASGASGLYFNQMSWEMHGALDVTALARAWQETVARHTALRTAFFWEGLEAPLQLVMREVQLPIRSEDWREVPPSERQARLGAWLEEDLRRGFEVERAPLMRIALMRIDERAWLFALSYSHLLLDGWSLPLLLGEVFGRYEAQVRGLARTWPEARPYRDFIEWLKRRDLGEAREFWRRSLAGFSSPTRVWADRGPVADGTPVRREKRVHLAPEQLAALQAFSRRNQVTLGTCIQGAWALLLRHHSGEDDVVFGNTSSGRPATLPGVEALVGLFINTLPVRVRMPRGEPVGGWLRELQAWLLEMRQYDYTPLVEAQRCGEVPLGTPLFETLVVVENFPLDGSLGKGAELEVRDVRSYMLDSFPLTLIAETHQGLSLHLLHDERRIDGADAERMLGHLQVLLARMVESAERPVAELSPLDEAERQRVLREWNATAVAREDGGGLAALLEAQVARTPEALAVGMGPARLTFRELDARANQVAHRLRRMGVGPDVRVGLCVERSLDLVVGLWGILKAGGAYVPLDPAYPPERLRYMLEDSGAGVVVTEGEAAAGLVGPGQTSLRLDAEAEALRAEPETPVPGGAGPEHLAYAIYTSGSTGRPKAVMVRQRAVANLIEALHRAVYAPLGPGRRVSVNGSVSFDTSVKQLFQLLRGHALDLTPESVRFDGEALREYLEQQRVDVFDCTPSQLLLLQETGWLEEATRPVTLLVGGEALSETLWRSLAASRRVRAFNVYGPTECTVDATVCPVTAEHGRPVLGRPIDNVRLYVLDGDGQPVGVGVAGELFIGGAGLARGYLGRPDATAERFVPDPFGGEPGARLYRTGDRARWLADGTVEFLGRVDFQVKLRGHRIELGEVEAALREQPSVRDAVAAVREYGPGDQRLVAYVVVSALVDTSELRAALKTRLPEPMVPAAIVELSAFPLTPSGKVDRKALPLPGSVRASGGFVPPRTDTERRLAELWSRTLGVERVGVGDHFFELGGHSLLATQLVSRVRGGFGVELSLRAVFESPRLEELARRVEEAPRLATGTAAPPPLIARREEEVLLSFAQQRLWFLERLQPGSAAYNIPYAVRLTGPLDIPSLERGLEEIVQRHQVLRTTFGEHEGRPVARVAARMPVPLGMVELSELPADEREAEVLRLAEREARTPFVLAEGPLLRTTLLRLGEADHVLLLTMHHIVTDGWSTGIFVRELAALYGAFSRGESSPLPELPLQYADYARWQREWLQGEVLEGQLGYWKQRLAGSPPVLNLPLDRPRPEVPEFHEGTRRFSLSRERVESLRALGQREGCSLFMVLLGSFQALLAHWSGQEDIVVGTPVAGRTRAEVEGLIGFFVNTLVLRTDVSGSPTFRELLARVREVALGAYAHQDVPFEKLVEELRPVRDMRYTPLFQVMFSLQNMPRTSLELPGLTLTGLEPVAGSSKFDLSLALEAWEGGLRGLLSYNARLFDEGTVGRWISELEALLAEVARAPDEPLPRVLGDGTARARPGLPPPLLPRRPARSGYVEPEGPVAIALARLWRELLRVERVGMHDDFFELGGHSLLATQLVSRVRKTFGVELPLRTLFDAPTLGAWAARIAAAREVGSSAQPVLQAKGAGDSQPLSFAQQRLWFLEQLQPGSSAYNIPYALRLEGRLERKALERALEEVVRRHEVLRVSFESRAGEPVLRLNEPPRLSLDPVDLSALDAGRRDEEVERRASEEAGRPFELSEGPLLRATLLRLAEREHVLLLTVHHIVFDGWSTGILFRELAALYGAFSRGEPSPLPELPLQYADYARWQREWLKGEVLEAQLGYWKQRLAGSPPVLNLPLDKPRPARRSSRAGHVPVALSREVSEALESLAQQEGCSLFMVLLGGFQALLARWSGQEDIVVGTPVAGRTRAEVEELIGFFVNTLVLRTDVSGAPTFRELLARVREVALGAYAHQDVPFEKLVEELRPVRELRHSPLFQVMFALQNIPTREVSLPGLKLSPMENEGVEAKLDVVLSLTRTPEGLRGAFTYDAALFEPVTIERLARHLETLLAAVAAAPDRRVEAVELLRGEERTRVLEEWSRGPRVDGPVDGLGRLLERQAARTPEAMALEGSGQRLSYGELRTRARKLAHRLRREGVGPEVRVGVLLEKSVEAVVAFWGIQLAGGVYVPLEAVQPPERLAWMAEDASVHAVVTRRGLEERCRLAEGVRVVRVEDVGEAEAGALEAGVLPDNAAYILYTSGSTGRPKGVVVTHEGACDLVRGKAGAFGVGAESRVLQFSSLGFDVSLWDYLLALAVGGTLYVPSGGKVPLGEELRRELVEGSVTVLALPPSVLALLPQEGLEHLRVVMAAGEACPPELVERWGRGRRFVNGYGPTEVSVLATWEECEPGEGRPPIGRPLANTRAYVLDGAMRPVPPGVAGELYLGGPGLARGYMGRPELTAERFVPDALSGEPGARLYRTGDVVRWRADGRLDYLGRADAQVKVNGVRVEPGEVETVLRELAGAKQAHVRAWKSPSGESRLVAYVVPGESTPREERELRARLRHRLMEAMVPSVCVYLEALPLTSSGKVDGRALPAPEEVHREERERVAPRDELERELVNFWEEVLGVRPVGVTDSFFELGGQSLLAVRLVARLQERLGHAVPLAALFEGPTIEQLAARLRADVPAPVQGNRVTLQPQGSLTPVFWVHPVGGNVLCYAELARRLGTGRPFHALQATGLDGREAPLQSVEDMARRYVEQVRAVQPEGPYLLGGWSLGGTVAFEMARALRRQGQEVASLVLLDSFAPAESPQLEEPDDATLLAGFAADLARSAGREVSLTPESLAGLSPEERIRALWTHARESGLLPPTTGVEELRVLLEVARANLRAVARYRPEPYAGRVKLLRARDARRRTGVDPTHGWGRLISNGLAVEDVPGDHHGILRAPHVGELAERLARWLAEADGKEGGTPARTRG
ncbi:amino acid adenylation domain-containing protein [Archangium violaceum]|uniref:non-ribosomal peptide synthetase n=1 Tax=Archangium violaceum TaxID=83451 RepID=UPI00193BC722|nr:non-ribosomal peptide synthetase [Archangium violaceum]QRK06023.1 amino acid adenylation domain-containing protein [Archangium violaceum]